MLKIYDMKSFFRLDQQDWQEARSSGWFCKDDSEVQSERVIINDVSWNKVYDALNEIPCDPLFTGRTLFRKRPYIDIAMSWPGDSVRVFPQDCKTFSYKVESIERKYMSLEWIMKNLSADKAIQYLKERGITTCPIMTK